MIETTKPKNYLSNREIMKEIHLSKNTYCYFTKHEYNQYDHIISCEDDDNLATTLQKIHSPEAIQSAKECRAARIDASNNAKNITDPESIPITDLVFRIMTWEHIPIVEKIPPSVAKKEKKKVLAVDLFQWQETTEEDEEYIESCVLEDIPELVKIPELSESVKTGRAAVNFPPFQHWKINENNEFYCVGKSHWRGDLETGSFCATHGETTKTLAKMYMLMCQRYSSKWNWRNYCVDDTTVALTNRGWLGIDEITENDFIASYNNGAMTWSKIKSVFRGDYEGEMYHMIADNYDSLVTPGHKILTERGLVDVQALQHNDVLILMGEQMRDHSDDLIEDARMVMNGLRPSINGTLHESFNRLPVSQITFNGCVQLPDNSSDAYPTIPYIGRIWCPETEYGCFVAKRNNTVYLTGNSYRDEMQSTAVLQLVYIGLRFNEAKSSNPFAYWTSVITNIFRRVLATEKKNQSIRDGLLEINGMSPSWSRQSES
jgi:hypothetical protein